MVCANCGRRATGECNCAVVGVDPVIVEGSGTSTDPYKISVNPDYQCDCNGIEAVVDNGDGSFTITLDDGSSTTIMLPPGPQGPEGPQGPAGAAGANVTGVVDNGDGTFALTLSDGTTTGDIATIPGADGADGTQWFTGDGPPAEPIPGANPGDLYLDNLTGDYYELQGA